MKSSAMSTARYSSDEMKIDLGGVVVGVIGDSGSGVEALLDSVEDATTFPYTLDAADPLQRLQSALSFESLRRSGKSVMLASHDVSLLSWLADEVWWMHQGQVKAKGDPAEVLGQYATHTAQRLRAAEAPVLPPPMRRGDGRAELIELNAPSTLMSGDNAEISVRVRFHADVADPVVGIMIRTRIGMEVYGTNTELEGTPFGPCKAGEVVQVKFAFRCDLCPGIYTITAASHDPDGVWHDWREDAVGFTVASARYVAGVANLRATVTCSRE